MNYLKFWSGQSTQSGKVRYLKVLIIYSNAMDDNHKNIEEYNPNKNVK